MMQKTFLKGLPSTAALQQWVLKKYVSKRIKLEMRLLWILHAVDYGRNDLN